jgi:circadian clock protein KaiC
VDQSKVKTGVPGLDEILFGGVWPGESVLVEGLPGTGKTTLGLHFILQGIAEGESGIIFTFEEFPAQYYRDALQFGWDLKQLEADQRLKIVMTSPEVLLQEMERPAGFLDQLQHELKASRVLVDSINFLYHNHADARGHRELINRFINAFKRQSVTVFLIKDIEMDVNSQWGMYSVDCYIRLVFELIKQNQRRRYIEVFKARGQNHLHGLHPFEITQEGLEVYPAFLPKSIRPVPPATPSVLERLSSGVKGLDEMLGGGYIKGHQVLLTGMSGTGKTNLALHFIHQGLRQNESCLFLSMEGQGAMLATSAESLGLSLQEALESERLMIVNLPGAGISGGEFLYLLRKYLDEVRPKRVVIDPISFLNNSAMSEEQVHLTFQSILTILRGQRITALCTSEISEVVGDFKLNEHNLAYLMDTVVLLRLAEIEGSIRKAIMIVKQRGSGHDRTLRDLHMDYNGIRIGDPFFSHEGILGGQTRRRSVLEPSKLLIVDDDPQMMELIKASFRNERFTLLGCADGEAALQMTMLEAPDLIVLDLMLPKLNGFEVCRRLKSDQATADIPIILLSAKGETESKVQGMKIGADDYVTKPFSPQELVARVKMILRRTYGKRLPA